MVEFVVSVSPENFGKLDVDTQIEAMRNWFYERFEDPAVRTPYESREGGYQWIWGGPFDAREELESCFAGIAADNAIESLVDELEVECSEWAPTESPDDYADHDMMFLEDVLQEDSRASFAEGISELNELIKECGSSQIVRKLAFANVITVLETYLYGRFCQSVLGNSNMLRRFVENCTEFGGSGRNKVKVPLSDVLRVAEEIETRVKESLTTISWHNLPRVRNMYKETLEVDIGDCGEILKAVEKRHDLVHRNGRNTDGEPSAVTAPDIAALIAHVEAVVDTVENQLSSDSRFGDGSSLLDPF